MNIKTLLCALVLGCVATPLFAKEVKIIEIEEISYVTMEDDDDDEFETYWDRTGFLISLRGGLNYAKVGGETSDVLLDPLGTPNKYVPEDKWHSALEGSALIGFEFFTDTRNRWQTGVSYYQTGNFEVGGVVQQLSDPEFTNLEFNYNVRNQRVLWENRWLTALNERIFLYFMGGIGASFNKASDFDENNDLNSFAEVDPLFEDQTTSSFTYSFGFGFEGVITEDLRLGIGYQYSDLGKVELDEFEGQHTDDTINVSSSPSQEVLLILTYFF